MGREDARQEGEQPDGPDIQHDSQEAGAREPIRGRIDGDHTQVHARCQQRDRHRCPAAASQCNGDREKIQREDVWRGAVAGQEEECARQCDGNAYLRGRRQVVAPTARHQLMQHDHDHHRQPAEAEDDGLVGSIRIGQADADQHRGNRDPPQHADDTDRGARGCPGMRFGDLGVELVLSLLSLASKARRDARGGTLTHGRQRRAEHEQGTNDGGDDEENQVGWHGSGAALPR